MAAHGRRPWRYFADGWNVFDFGILALCLLPVGGPFAAVLRLVRAFRLLRLVTALPKLQLLVGALLKSLSSMGYVGLLLAMMFYIYAVAGVHLFGGHDPGHFGSLGTALFSLFRIVTLDNWADIYSAQLAHVPALKAIILLRLVHPVRHDDRAESLHRRGDERHDRDARADPERDRARHLAECGAPTFADELIKLEEQLRGMQARIASLRRNSAGAGFATRPNFAETRSRMPGPEYIEP